MAVEIIRVENVSRVYGMDGVEVHALRSVEHAGGLDNFLLKSKDNNLSPKA